MFQFVNIINFYTFCTLLLRKQTNQSPIREKTNSNNLSYSSQIYLIIYQNLRNLPLNIKYQNMPLEDFEMLEELGKGAFGVVRKCKRKIDGQVYAIKQVRIDKLKQKDKINALNQIRILASVTSPYIIGYKEAFYDEKSSNLCIILEFADGGDLTSKIKDHTKNKTRFKQAEVWETAYQLLKGLQKMHSSKILHRDIKSANIFYSKNIAKLGDLNISKLLKDELATTQTGTPYYACPEVWCEQPYGAKGDVWSLGCVLYEMCCFEPPFKGKDFKALHKKIMTGVFMRLPMAYSSNLNNLIGRCLIVDPRKRSSIDELLELNEFKIFQHQEREQNQQNLEAQFFQTIQMPKNLKQLNGRLPHSNYEDPKKLKTVQDIEAPIQSLPRKGSLAKIPSLTLVTSQKKLVRPSSSKNILVNKHQNYTKMLQQVQIQKNALLKVNSSQKALNIQRLPRSYKYIK